MKRWYSLRRHRENWPNLDIRAATYMTVALKSTINLSQRRNRVKRRSMQILSRLNWSKVASVSCASLKTLIDKPLKRSERVHRTLRSYLRHLLVWDKVDWRLVWKSSPILKKVKSWPRGTGVVLQLRSSHSRLKMSKHRKINGFRDKLKFNNSDKTMQVERMMNCQRILHLRVAGRQICLGCAPICWSIELARVRAAVKS